MPLGDEAICQSAANESGCAGHEYQVYTHSDLCIRNLSSGNKMPFICSAEYRQKQMRCRRTGTFKLGTR